MSLSAVPPPWSFVVSCDPCGRHANFVLVSWKRLRRIFCHLLPELEFPPTGIEPYSHSQVHQSVHIIQSHTLDWASRSPARTIYRGRAEDMVHPVKADGRHLYPV